MFQRYGSTELSAQTNIHMSIRSSAKERREESGVVSVTCEDDDELLKEELDARHKAAKNSLYLVVANLFSTVLIFLFYLVSVELIVSTGLTVGFTVYVFRRLGDQDNFDAGSMTFTLLSFAIISPVTATIRMGFKRREDALFAIADLRSTLIQIYGSHACWDWGQKPGVLDESGRTRSSVDWLSHTDQVCSEILYLVHELTRYLTLPNATRARHRATPFGKREAKCTNAIADKLYSSVLVRISRLSGLCELLKREGLPPNEATRIRQWERFVMVAAEKLRMIKSYRTPQGLRSFGRLFSFILPPFYAPFFAELGFRMNSLAIGIIFGVLTTMALSGLFETVSQFEDPFSSVAVLDGVHVAKELVCDFTPQLLSLRKHIFPAAPEFEVSVDKDDEVTRESDTSLLATMRIINNQ